MTDADLLRLAAKDLREDAAYIERRKVHDRTWSLCTACEVNGTIGSCYCIACSTRLAALLDAAIANMGKK